MTRKRSVICCSLTSNNISRDGYSQTSQKSGHPMQPYLPKELVEIYSPPTPKGWPEPKKVKVLYLFDRCEMSIKMARVQYLYPRLDCESWSNKIGYKLGKEDKSFLNYDNLDLHLSLIWSPTCLLVPCLADSADRAHSPNVVILLAGW
jgi:hypothetical protein